MRENGGTEKNGGTEENGVSQTGLQSGGGYGGKGGEGNAGEAGYLDVENHALSFHFWPPCSLRLGNAEIESGPGCGGFVFVSREGDAVILNVSRLNISRSRCGGLGGSCDSMSTFRPILCCELSQHTGYDALRARRASKTGLLPRLPKRQKPPPPPGAPPLKRGLFDPAHSDSFDEMVSELNNNLDSEYFENITSDSAADDQEMEEVAREFIERHRAAGGLAPQPIHPDEIN